MALLVPGLAGMIAGWSVGKAYGSTSRWQLLGWSMSLPAQFLGWYALFPEYGDKAYWGIQGGIAFAVLYLLVVRKPSANPPT